MLFAALSRNKTHWLKKFMQQSVQMGK